MNIFKNISRIFGGGAQAGPSKDNGIYFYVKAHRCNEVIQVRLNPMNDLSHLDDESGHEGKDFYARKVIVGRKCYDRMEAEFKFDVNKKLIHKAVIGGIFVDEAAYQTWQTSAEAQIE